MRLLHMVHTLNPERGGPSESVRMFVLAHQRAGNQVEVATLDDPAEDFRDRVSCEVHPCGPGLGCCSQDGLCRVERRGRASAFTIGSCACCTWSTR